MGDGVYRGRWHGSRIRFGFHRDLHVELSDTGIGSRCTAAELVAQIRLSGADFVQTDSKGHPGYTSWPSRNPDASAAPGIERDALAAWRAATRSLGMPLHAHYSGIWDKAAGARHPEWCIVSADGTPARAPWAGVLGETGDKMCPRSGYVDELLIPQLLEMVDRYGIDGFWVDGDIWAMEPCYCGRCRSAFRERTGVADPPRSSCRAGLGRVVEFHPRELRGLRRAATVEARAPPGAAVLVCSNWLQTFRHPGEPRVPTDWISGDNSPVWGMDSGRCEARFISTRGKPWDIMMWDFYFSHGMARRPGLGAVGEAGADAPAGGRRHRRARRQRADLRQPLRRPATGPARRRGASKRIGEVARFVKRRMPLCQGTETIPQVAVLHSEHHARSKPVGPTSRDIDTAPVQGAVFSLLECSCGVDILDEWALLPRIADFPLVVCPEQDRLSDAMVERLRVYVAGGGRLLVSGAAALDRFGKDFLGVGVRASRGSGVRHVPSGDGAVAVWSASWALVEPEDARGLGALGETPSREERLLPHPAAVLNRVGRGRVAWVPFDVFRDFERNRYPMLRKFIRSVADALSARAEIRVAAPACVDVILRRKGGRRYRSPRQPRLRRPDAAELGGGGRDPAGRPGEHHRAGPGPPAFSPSGVRGRRPVLRTPRPCIEGAGAHRGAADRYPRRSRPGIGVLDPRDGA